MPLKLYADFFSQPCRAVGILLKALKVDFELITVALAKGEQNAKSFIEVSPMKSLPVIDDDGFILTETAAIMRYIAAKFAPGDKWNPSDLQKKARVDEYLAWQHTGLRKANTAVFLPVVVYPRMSGKPIDIDAVKSNCEALEKALNQMDELFLRDHAYLTGHEVGIADINAACEIMQVVAIGYPIGQGRPRLENWLQRVKTQFNPHFDEYHSQIVAMGQKVTYTF